MATESEPLISLDDLQAMSNPFDAAAHDMSDTAEIDRIVMEFSSASDENARFILEAIKAANREAEGGTSIKYAFLRGVAWGMLVQRGLIFDQEVSPMLTGVMQDAPAAELL